MKDIKIREQAKRLYVFDGKSLSEVANILKVSKRTIFNWSSEYKWLEQRNEYLSLKDTVELGMLRLLSASIDKALTTLDNQDIFAVVQLHMSMGNANNQYYLFRRRLVKNLIEIENLSYEEIGKRLGLSIDRVKMIHKKAINAGDSGQKTSGGRVGDDVTG